MNHREAWLAQAAIQLRAEFAELGFQSATDAKVSCGWPHKHGLARKNRRVGECWTPESSSAGVCEIFISPLLADTVEVMAVLAHELAHAIVGVRCRHKGPFVKAVRAIGLVGKPTSTSAGEAFLPLVEEMRLLRGDYPHSAMNAESVDREKKKVTQSTRMLKLSCPECGYTVRTTQKWIDIGLPSCPVDESPLMPSGGKGDSDDD